VSSNHQNFAFITIINCYLLLIYFMKIIQKDNSGIVSRSPITDRRLHFSEYSSSFQLRSNLGIDILKWTQDLSQKQYIFEERRSPNPYGGAPPLIVRQDRYRWIDLDEYYQSINGLNSIAGTPEQLWEKMAKRCLICPTWWGF